MTFQADYPGAIVVEAAQYGYVAANHPVGFVYHTPEEIADDDPQTPGYLAGTEREASYTYFVSFLGFIFQLVPESEGAYANAVMGKPYPPWADPTVNLNLQGISISFEGMAATIHRTMVRGQSQWNAGVDLVAHRAKAQNINPDHWARHADVSVARGDPGSLDLVQFTLDVKAKMEPVPEPIEEDDMKPVLINTASDGTHYLTDWMSRWAVSKANLEELRRRKVFEGGSVDTIPEELMAAIPLGHGPAKATGGGGSGLTAEEAIEASQEASRRGTG